MFSFNADDIIELKIPSKVVGCSGRADLFAKYASEMGLDVNVVAMVDIAEKDKDKPNGHQIIAVKFPDGSQQLIDPGLAENYQAAKVKGNCALGTEIIIPGQPKYEIRAILTPDTHAKIDSQEKLAQIYKKTQINSEVREKSERERRIKSLRLATEELGKQVQHGPYVSMDELKRAQAQQAYLGYGNTHE